MSNEVEFNSLQGKDEVKVKLEQPSRVPQKPSDEEVAKYSKTRMVLVVFFGLVILAMIVAAVVIIIVAPKCAKAKVRDMDKSWLENEVVYKISAQQFNKNLTGIIDKLGYLENLGVKVLSIGAVFSEEDLQDVNNALGKMEDFQNLLKKAHDRKMRVIVDFVPNHTSKKNKWFEESSVNKTNSKRNWYVWRDSANNWPSMNGGSAWEKDPKTNQYYLHQFSVDQPDLNYHEEAVVKAINGVVKFWSEKGVDGFSVSGIEYLLEDSDFRNDGYTEKFNASLPLTYDMTKHNSTYDLDGNLNIVKTFRDTLDEVDGSYRALVVQVSSTKNIAALYNSSDLPVAALANKIDLADLPGSINKTVMAYLAMVPAGKWPTFTLGDSKIDDKMVDAMNVLLLTLPGTPLSTSGQELGLESMKWDGEGVKEQEKGNKSHYSVYKAASALRRNDAFKKVKTQDIHVDSQVYAYLRADKYLVVINFSDKEWNGDLPKISGHGVCRLDNKFEMVDKIVDPNTIKLQGGQVVVIEMKSVTLM